jgi:hypothetical protein
MFSVHDEQHISMRFVHLFLVLFWAFVRPARWLVGAGMVTVSEHAITW